MRQSNSYAVSIIVEPVPEFLKHCKYILFKKKPSLEPVYQTLAIPIALSLCDTVHEFQINETPPLFPNYTVLFIMVNSL